MTPTPMFRTYQLIQGQYFPVQGGEGTDFPTLVKVAQEFSNVNGGHYVRIHDFDDVMVALFADGNRVALVRRQV